MRIQIRLLFLWLTFLSVPAIAQIGNGLTTNPRGNGLCFTPKKGRIVDFEGKVHPDILYRKKRKYYALQVNLKD